MIVYSGRLASGRGDERGFGDGAGGKAATIGTNPFPTDRTSVGRHVAGISWWATRVSIPAARD
jgi:hypothetical protein